MTAQLMPWAISRETDATNLPLSGGKVYTYQAGTTTPYPTWADADQTIPNANPVILDAGGFAPIFLDPAQSYDIEIQDATGAQVVPVFHNIRLSQASSAVTNTLGIFANYDALRNQTGTAYAVAVVLGRTSSGDGGQGIFWKMATSPWVDDDGSVLVNGANVYSRQADYLDPLWFGAVYSLASNQAAAISHAAIASAARAVPVVVRGSLFLQSGLSFPSGSAVKFVLPGKLTSDAAVSVTFADGAQLIEAAPGCFAGEVQPLFSGPISEVRSSWFANVSGDRVAAKWLACSSLLTRAILDSAIPGLTTVTASALYDFDVEGGSLAYQNATGGALNLSRIIYDGIAKWISGPVNSTYLATASAGSPVRPEWFGAFGNGSTDDFYALANASVFGAIKLRAGSVYLCALGNVLASRIECDGNTQAEIRFSASRALAATNLRISGIIVSGDANCVQASTLFARDCTFPSGYAASVSADIDGCTFTGDSRAPVLAGKPALYNPHLPLIVSAKALGTDAQGKIQAVTEFAGDISESTFTYIDGVTLSVSCIRPHVISIGDGGDTGGATYILFDNSAEGRSMTIASPSSRSATYVDIRGSAIGAGLPFAFNINLPPGQTFVGTENPTTWIAGPRPLENFIHWTFLRVGDVWYAA